MESNGKLQYIFRNRTSKGLPVYLRVIVPFVKSDDPKDPAIRTSISINWSQKYCDWLPAPNFRQTNVREMFCNAWMRWFLPTSTKESCRRAWTTYGAFNFKQRWRLLNVYADYTGFKRHQTRNIPYYFFSDTKYPGVPQRINLNTILINHVNKWVGINPNRGDAFTKCQYWDFESKILLTSRTAITFLKQRG